MIVQDWIIPHQLMLSSSSRGDSQAPNLSKGQSSQPSAYNSANEIHMEPIVINSPTRPAAIALSDGNPTIASYGEIIDYLDESAIKLGRAVFLSAIFSATIITAFLSLAGDVIGKQNQAFELAMFFCTLAGTCNISNVLVCGRACILAYQHKFSQRPSTINHEEYSQQLEAATRTQQLTLWIQGLGQALFGVAVLYTVWQMIRNKILVAVIFGFALILQVVVYDVGFWRISWAESMILPGSKWCLRLLRREKAEDVRQ